MYSFLGPIPSPDTNFSMQYFENCYLELNIAVEPVQLKHLFNLTMTDIKKSFAGIIFSNFLMLTNLLSKLIIFKYFQFPNSFYIK